MAMNRSHADQLLQRIQKKFIGLDTSYQLANGDTRRRVYLDSAATTLMLSAASQVAVQFLAHYANTHSRVHFSARTATECYARARERVLSFVGADPKEYACLFIGNGATGALNRAAYYLREFRQESRTVLVSLMEHHSNDLPHRQRGQVRHVPLAGATPALGAVDVDAFIRLLRAEPIQYAAINMVSNVTGIVNPIARLTEAARAEGVPILIDASQAIAHIPVRMDAMGEPDAIVFSGHKAYAPGSPGVLIIRRDIVDAAPPSELGGGMVSHVTKEYFTFTDDLVDRAEAGTPNILGAVTLGVVMEVLGRIGMEAVAEHEQILTEYLIQQLLPVPEIRVYGSVELERWPRVGVATFNVGGLDHGFVAAVLNDYYNIAVRNQCFCAHPYVQAMLYPELWDLDVSDDAVESERMINRKRGMVRASLAMYSTREDVDALVFALKDIQANAGRYREEYRLDDNGEYCHTRFTPPCAFDIFTAVDRLLDLPDGSRGTKA